ncbi:MAG: hypothetical protein C0613_09155 [Desulfobulbaceae bacterium]|nr:MAG: hypothetical protein C0613_09155 [Desulfobulbaceae bacterium]
MQQRINLIPQKPLADRIKHLIPILFVGMAALLTLFFVVWIQLLNGRLTDLNKQIVHLETQADQATELSSQVARLKKNLQDKDNAIRRKNTDIAGLTKIGAHKKRFSRPLRHIAALVPDSVRLRSLTFTGNSGEIQGTALDYNDLVDMIHHMQALSVFANVSLTVTDRSTDKDQERIEFTIQMRLT